MRQRVTPEQYTEVTSSAGQFMTGSLPVGAFFGLMQRLGLAGLVPDMAALLPDDAKRRELLGAFTRNLEDAQPSGSGCVLSSTGSLLVAVGRSCSS